MMKKTLLSLFALSASLAGFAASPNPFAYALSSEYSNSTLNVAYSLNTAADAAELQVLKDGVVVKTQAVETTAGAHTASIDLSAVEAGNYTWQIAVTGGQKTSDDGAALQNFVTWKFYHPCGLDVDKSFESASFGTLLVAEGKHPSGLTDDDYTGGLPGSAYVSYPSNNGITDTDGNAGGLYMFTPALESIKGKDGYARFYDADLTWSDQYAGKSQADFSRVGIADDGRVFVTRCNSSGDYILYAPSVADLIENGDFTSLLEGKTMTDAIYYDDNNNFLVGAIQGFDVMGSGENTKLVAITRDQNAITIKASINRVLEYEIGNGTTLPAANSVTAMDAKSNYTLSYDRSADLKYDNNGGIWYCQYQSAEASVNLAYINADGEEKYTSTTNTYRRGAIAVSNDGTQLALASGTASGKFSIFDITFGSDGVPTVTETSYTVSPGGGNLYALTWDAAGNVYAGNAGSEYVMGFAVPRANNTFATKAASKYNFVVSLTGIETIGADENAPVEYYNLQGVKVENPENGIFIKKQGNKTVKVVL